MADSNDESVNDFVTSEVDSTYIKNESGTNEKELESLGTWAMDQDDLERDVAKKAEEAMAQRDNELDAKRKEKTQQNIKTWQTRIEKLYERLDNPRTKISDKEKARIDIKHAEDILVGLRNDINEIQQRLDGGNAAQEVRGNGRMQGESEHDYLVRTGKITPFSNTFMGSKGVSGKVEQKPEMSHQQLRLPGMELDMMMQSKSQDPEYINEEEEEEEDTGSQNDEYELEEDEDIAENEDDDFELSDVELKSTRKRKSSNKSKQKSKKIKKFKSEEIDDLKDLDDGNELAYQTRLAEWVSKREAYREMINQQNGNSSDSNDNRKEWEKPHPTHPDVTLDDQFKMPGDIYTSLFDYQKTGVQWLWELYSQKVGGIIGDEMGLGKTIQIVSFIAGLHYSGLLNKPVLIVCPATVMKQWVNEFHRWWPALRVVILHSMGAGMDYANEAKLEEKLETDDAGTVKLNKVSKLSGASSIIDNVMKNGKKENKRKKKSWRP